MSTYYYTRDGRNKFGPFTAQQLQGFVQTRQLVPTDMVLIPETGRWVKAASLSWLFSNVAAPPLPPLPGEIPSGQKRKKSSGGKIALILGGSVVGVMLLCCGSCGVIAFLGNRESQALKKELAEADSLWRSGKKSEAVAIYRAKRDSSFLDQEDRLIVYGRLIDFEYESDNSSEGKRLIDEASKKNVAPSVNHPEAKALIAEIAAQKEKEEAEKKEKEKLAAKKSKVEAMHVRSEDLFLDYKDNEVAADEKYKNKILQVTGPVKSIDKDLFDNIVIRLEVERFAGIHCSVDSKSKGEAVKLRRGDSVTIRGKCTGRTLGRSDDDEL